jgi:uncharacterized membrane protein
MTYISSIIAIIATAVITSVAEYFSVRLIRSFTKYTPKKKRAALLVSLMIKYVFFALLMILFVLKMDFNKSFVVSISLLVLLCSYCIAKDVLMYTMRSVTFSLETENLQKEIETYLNILAKCDSKDKEKQELYMKKIQELLKQKDTL